MITMVAGCTEQSTVYRGVPTFNSFRDIPGVTDEEIADIEMLQRNRDYFIFGSTYSTEAFEMNGFLNYFRSNLNDGNLIINHHIEMKNFIEELMKISHYGFFCIEQKKQLTRREYVSKKFSKYSKILQEDEIKVLIILNHFFVMGHLKKKDYNLEYLKFSSITLE